jgi:prepilin-type N-terminal cleavage/methylation domain-containing protein
MKIINMGASQQYKPEPITRVRRDPSRISGSAGFTMVETIVAIAVLGIGVATTIGALTKVNSIAAMSRNCTGAYTILNNQVDLFQSMSPFNPQKSQIPVDNPASYSPAHSYVMYDMRVGAQNISVDGVHDYQNVPVYQYKDPVNGQTLVVRGTLTETVTDLNFAGTNPSSGPYQAVFTITFKYLNRTYTYSMSTIRTSDI